MIADLHGLAPNAIHDYVIVTSKPLTRASRKHLVSGLRSFLRFAHANGLIERPLVETPKGVRLCRPQDTVREII